MSKIYVVTKGDEYDGYRIITATTDEELAKEIIKKYEASRSDEVRIETYEDAEKYRKKIYRVEFDGDTIRSVKDVSDCGEYYEYIDVATLNELCNIRVVVQADDEDSAIIIAKRLRIEYLKTEEKLKVIDLVDRLKFTNYCPLDYDELLGEKTDKYMYENGKKWCEGAYSSTCVSNVFCWEQYLKTRLNEIEHKFDNEEHAIKSQARKEPNSWQEMQS